MKEVTKEEYDNYVFGSNLDLVVSVHGIYPFEARWKTRSGILKAKSVPDGLTRKYYIESGNSGN
jgi:hypothetical protein